MKLLPQKEWLDRFNQLARYAEWLATSTRSRVEIDSSSDELACRRWSPPSQERHHFLRATEAPAERCYLKKNELALLGQDPAGLDSRFSVRAEIYGHANLQNRVCLLVPPVGGLTPLDRRLARKLAAAGAWVFAIAHHSHDLETSPDWRVHHRGVLRGLTSIRWTLAWVKRKFQERFGDSPSFAVTGASMGALHSALASAVEPEIERTALIVGGAPVSAIAAASQQAIVSRMRHERMVREGIDGFENYLERMEEEVPFDLWDLAQPRESCEHLIFVGAKDDVVPTATQRALAERFQASRVIELSGGHYSTIIRAQLLHSAEIVSHLLDKGAVTH